MTSKNITMPKQKLQLKGMDILHSLDQDLVSWQNLMSLMFMKNGLTELLSDVVVKPERAAWTAVQHAEQAKLDLKDHASFEFILMTHLSGEVLRLVQRKLVDLRNGVLSPNGRQAWKALSDVFQGAGSAGKHLWLTKMFDFKFACPPTAKNLAHGLSQFRGIHTKLCELNVNIDEEILGIKLASALPKSQTGCQMVFSAAMQSKKPTISYIFTKVEALILEFECDEYSESSSGMEHGMAAHGTVRAGKGQMFCTCCEKWGLHLEKDCYQNPKAPHYPNGPNGKSARSGRHQTVHQKQVQHQVDKAIKAYIAQQAVAHVASAHATPAKSKSMKRRERQRRQMQLKVTNATTSSDDGGYCAHEDSSSDNESFIEYANLSVIHSSFLPDHDSDRWIADSGATSHMTHSSDSLYNIQPTIGLQVRVGDGNCVDCLYKGSLNIKNKQGKHITLRDVLYVPRIGINLLSIGKFQQSGFTSTFPGKRPDSPNPLFLFIKNQKGQRHLSAKLVNSLYLVEMTRLPASLQSAHPAESMELLHQRLGHIPFRKIRSMKDQLSKQNISIVKEHDSAPCLGCSIGKLHRADRQKSRLHPATEPLEVVHTDITGPYQKSSYGNRWLILFVDEFTRLSSTYPMKYKSDALSCFRKYRHSIENDRKKIIKKLCMSNHARDHIMRLQSDGGGEYKSNAFAEYLSSEGIQHYTSCADTPSQNGIAERYIRTITETGLSMLQHAKLSLSYWTYAMRTATYLTNRIPKAILQNVSPYQKWTGTVPDLRFLRTFGADAHVRIVTQNKTKGGPKSHHCLFLGYREGLKGYVFQNVRTKRIISSGDAHFYEDPCLVNGVQRFDLSRTHQPPPLPTSPLGHQGAGRGGLGLADATDDNTNLDSASDDDYTSDDDSSEDDTTSHVIRSAPPAAPLPTENNGGPPPPDGPVTNSADPNVFPSVPVHAPSATATPAPIPFAAYPPDAPLQRTLTFGDAITHTIPARHDPTTHTIPARRSSQNNRSRRTLSVYNVDYNPKEKHTRSPSPPKARAKKKRPAPTRPFRREKRNRHPLSPPKDNTNRKRPSRHSIPDLALNAQATHYDGIHCPTTYKEAINGPQAKEWTGAMLDEFTSMNVNKVFGPKLHSLPRGQKGVSSKWIFTIKRDEKGVLLRYKARLVARGFTQRLGIDYDRTFAPVMKQSLLRGVLAEACHEDWDIEQVDIKTAFLYGELNETIYLKLPDGSYHLLQRAIYGLKQAGRQWYSRFNKSLERFGLQRLHGDPCCYHMRTGADTLIAMIHVDDVIITGSDSKMITKFKQALRDEYRMTDMGPIKHCLGWEISRDRKNRILTIGQRQYIKDLLRTYGVSPTKMKSCPASNITLRPLPLNMPRKDCPYLELLGAVLYIANSTRPDLSYAVSELSRYSSNPGDIHWDELNRILHYLNETQDHGLVYRGTQSPLISGFVDASYARCPITRKSRHGAVLLHSGCAIDWRSKMQTVVATSSMEAEYIGLCAAVKMAVWLQSCMTELQLASQSKITIGMDNQSAIIFGEEQIVQDRSKHIDIKFHYTREQIENGRIALKYVPTHKLPADMLTKPLPKTPMRIFRKDLGIYPTLLSSSTSKLGGVC